MPIFSMFRLGTNSVFRSIALGWLAIVVAAGCSTPASRDQHITFWVMGREGEVVSQLLPEFERSHPGIKIDVQLLPWTAAHEKLLTAYAGDSTPDVSQLGNTWVPELAALDALQPLRPFIAGSRHVRQDDYFPGIWDTNVIDGVLYGLPWYVDTRLVFYRRDLMANAGFATPPRDWAEWSRAMAAIKTQAGMKKYSILLPLNEFEPLLALALQQDEPLLRDGGRRGNFRSAGFRRALGFYVSMFQRSWAPRMSNTQISNVWDEFGRGFYAFYISGPWNIAEFKKRLPASQQGDWMTMPLPGPNGPGASIAGGSSLVVFRTSRHQAAAWQLIEYLSMPSSQQRLHELTGAMPARRSAWNNPRLAGDVYASAFRDQLERAKPTPKVPEWERIATEMNLVTEQAVHGDLTIDQAVTMLDARVDAILEKRRWMLDRSRTVAAAHGAAGR